MGNAACFSITQTKTVACNAILIYILHGLTRESKSDTEYLHCV
jgi:hypothetical protein